MIVLTYILLIYIYICVELQRKHIKHLERKLDSLDCTDLEIQQETEQEMSNEK